MYKHFFKRVLDFIFAAFLLLVLSPVIIIIAIILKIKQGNVLFIQERPGLDEKIFKIYKFKTMSDEKDACGNLLSDEMRLKPFGKLLRSLSLDELPQLFNVLKGDMSFIGPRPLLPEYLPLYTPEQRLRHSVRPGISGWAQVNGRNAISWTQKFEYDVYYVQHCSFFFDVKIVFLTLLKVLKRSGVSKQGRATTDKFNGFN